MLESDDSGESIDLAIDGLVGDQIGEELLGLGLGEVEKSGHSLRVDARVVLGHDSHVVLDNACLEVRPAFGASVVAFERVCGRVARVAHFEVLLEVLD